jgi:hypothetical protein
MLAKCITYLILLTTWNAVSAQDGSEYIDINSSCPKLSNLNGNIEVNSIQPSPYPPGPITLEFTLLSTQGIVGSFITHAPPGKYTLVWDAIPDPKGNKTPKLPPDAYCTFDMDSAGGIRFDNVTTPISSVMPTMPPIESVMPTLKSSSSFWGILCSCLPCCGRGVSADSEDGGE